MLVASLGQVQIITMGDMDLVAVRVAKVGAVVAVAIVRPRPWCSFVNAADMETGGIGCVHGFRGRRRERQHAAVARVCRHAVIGRIDVEPR